MADRLLADDLLTVAVLPGDVDGEHALSNGSAPALVGGIFCVRAFVFHRRSVPRKRGSFPSALSTFGGMARPDLRHDANAHGAWYVDERCIDCGTCRDLAPVTFVSRGPQSVVACQPVDPLAEQGAWLAAQACPTQSIGTLDHRPRPGRLYPWLLLDGVYDLGFTSPDSFGASSYLAARPEGGLMVDSPRFTAGLVRAVEDLGGVTHVLLTHRDDVADAGRWAEHFGAQVWVHEHDRSAAPFATDLVRGLEPVDVLPGVRCIPVPGHTRGSVVWVVGEVAFTGDSLAWSHQRGDLTAFKGACWYSWPAQLDSLERLAAGCRPSWVLPGHGARCHLPASELHERLLGLVARERSAA